MDKRTKCSQFRRHLTVLLWKNFLIRCRRPVFLTAELLTPLVLSLTLVGIRTLGKDRPEPNCLSQTISLPSMGLLNHVQSMLCNFNNTCQTTEPPPLSLDGQLQQELLTVMEQLSELNTTHPNHQTFMRLVRLIESVQTAVPPDPNFEPPRNTSIEETLDWISKISTILCGLPAEKNDLGSSVPWLKQSGVLSRLNSTTTTATPGADKENRTFCQELERMSNVDSVQPYVERLMFFLFGQIYYYPSTPLTDDVMWHATESQRLLEQIRLLAAHYLKHTAPALMRLVNTNRQLCSQDQTMRTELKQLCHKLWRLFPSDHTNSSTVNGLEIMLVQTEKLMSFVNLLLSCTNAKNRTLPMANQSEFDKMLTYSQRPTFPPTLGVYFKNLPNNTEWWDPTRVDATLFEIVFRKTPLSIDNTRNFNVFDRYWSPRPRQSPGSKKVRYLTSGFLDVQEAIGNAILSVIANNRSTNLDRSAFSRQGHGHKLKLFPTPCYLSKDFMNVFAKMMPQFMLFAWILTAMLTSKYIVEEKEQPLKEFSKIMGLSNLTHWFSWFVTLFSLMTIEVVGVTLCLKFGNILWSADYLMLMLLYMSYIVASIAFNCLCSTLFTRANLAAMVTGMVYFLLYLPTSLILSNESAVSHAAAFGASLSFQVAFGLGLYYFVRIEIQGIGGAQWADFWQARHATDVFSIGKGVLMLWIDTVIYLLLTWYIEAVYPGRYGVRRPLYFPLTKEYWYGTNTRPTDGIAPEERDKDEQANDQQRRESCSRHFELEINRQLSTGVSVFKITKRYKKNDRLALDQLTINFYANQITSLLGHNGAGKSTLISILTGMQAPTSGWARVAGYDVPRQLEQVRNHLGFCPQYNVLFDQLTVAEHIHFYASLRGIPNDQIKLEIEHLLDVLGFKDKRDCQSKTLSGGQKRKLSVAIAFVGNTSVVFLDEPTSGVDPFSRRSIWDLVMKLKAGRTIILTTHHMDEADILGDRIAIISQGRLKCYGSSLFLKANHGQGYHLILQRESPNDQIAPSTASGFSPGHVLEYVRRFMPHARLVNVTLTEVIIQLPTQYAHNGQFTQFFQHIDAGEDTLPGNVCEKLRKLGITAYGLSDTSLEEIFLELADDPADHQTGNTTDSQASEDINGAIDQSPMSYFSRRRAQLDAIRMSVRMSRFTDDGKLPLPPTRHSLTNRSHIFDQNINQPPTEATSHDMIGGHQGLTYSPHVSVAQQLRAMFSKRFHHFKRYKRGWAIEFLLPVILIILTLLFVSFVAKPYSNPPMPIHPWLMTVHGHKLHVFYENHMYATGDPDLNSSELQTIRDVASNYEKALTMPYGFTGTRCIPSSVYQIIPNDMASYPFWSQAANTLRMMLPPTHHLQIWFDNKGYVSAPAYLNMLQNMQLRMLLANGTSSDTLEAHRSAGIVIVNHPVELPPDVAMAHSNRTLMLDVTLAIFIILALSFIPASCITFLVTERHTGSKHLQFVSGLNAYVYWISVYLWDIMNYLIPAGLCILVFVAFQKYAFVGTDTIGPFILLIFFYGLAVLPMLYPFSFVIRSPSTALIVLVIVNMLFGALTVMVTFFLDKICQEDPRLTPVLDVLKAVFLVLPQYCLGRGLYDLSFREFMSHFRHTGLIDFAAYENPLGWNVLGQKLLALGLETVVFLTLILLVEHRFFKGPIKRYLYIRYPLLAKRTLLKIQKKIAQMTSNEPLNAEDVQFEQRRVFELKESNSLASTSAVSTLRLTKFFGRMKMPSVNQLTFAIHPGECFGLLGVNGAGKTTTFRMLTGSLKPTFGVAYVNGYNVVDQQCRAHRSLGFCPQFDAVHNLLTGRETLTLYARLRGVPEQSIPQTVSTLLNDMGLAPHADKVAGAYSGGNRRKLSTAIAILGDPQVIFLDEPTSGMDPLAKRFLWDQIIRLIKSGKSVLLTSHSMEECEALCDRLGIMANGQFRCLGSVQQLKNKFGNGYTAELRISESPESADQVRHTLQTEFPQLTVNNTQTKCYEYQFPQRVQLARLFETLNRLRIGGLIEQYSVKQTTLDQVFVNVTGIQMDQTEVSDKEDDDDDNVHTSAELNSVDDLDTVSSTFTSNRDIDGVTDVNYEVES
ncbi:hypothetical protein P879_06099 [Paragonimus westermani]|uniref:ABC transporter domain-containing protein n=1 Tax=Paragonimus westermani TaxID=34504 RepID=A0A8T0DAK9_9TREM|nr:hypothetical protein P879_06099 [Paragonimus westermani]